MANCPHIILAYKHKPFNKTIKRPTKLYKEFATNKKQMLSLARQHLFITFAWITRVVRDNSK